jgi:hypothetical protein
VLLCLALVASCFAQNTRTWEQSKYEEFEKGTAHGVAIGSDGTLTLAPAFTSLYTSPSTYLWDIASDSEGNVYAASGSPARVYKLTPDGKARIIFAPQELQVQALVVDAGGAIYAATSPDGKVYKLTHGGPAPGKSPEGSHTTAEVAAAQEGAQLGEKPRPSVEVDPSYSATVFFDPKTKYIWTLALDRQGQLYIGTGDRGEIFRVDRSGAGSLFFKSDEAQIRALVFDNRGNLIAGTDGSGLIYRISLQGEGFVLYSAPKKEITALAVDREGNIYAAGAGEKRGAAPSTTPPASTANVAAGAPPSTSTSIATPSAPAVSPPVLNVVPSVTSMGGSEIYRLSPDGSPKTIWSSREDLVYALAFDQQGRLLAGTGNRGKIYAITGNQYTDLAEASASQVTAFASAPKGVLYAATSNLGKVFRLGPSLVNEGAYESDVFDAKNFSRWGRVEVRGNGNFQLFGRSGNVDNPDRNWSQWKPIDLQKDLPIDAPSARYVQWKAVLQPASHPPIIDSVLVNYLPKNVAPEVDNVTVMVGSRVPSGTHTDSETSAAGAYEPPIPTVKDKRWIAVRWKAHDENDDSLLYDVYYRGDGETRWKLLRSGVEERYINIDSDVFPDGGYTIRVVASDAPSHSAEDALTGEATSSRFEVDNTPPRIESLKAKVEGNKIHVTFHAVDGFSPINQAEYSIDGGDWETVEPAGQISDSKTEDYDFRFALPSEADSQKSSTDKPSANSNPLSQEHTIIVRVYDRFDNMGVSKVVVNGTAGQ